MFWFTEDASNVVERVSSHGGSDSYRHAAVDSVPSTLSGVAAGSTDISRSHTPPERDVNSNKSSCMSNVGDGSTAENVSLQGLSFTICCIDVCTANSASINIYIYIYSKFRFLEVSFHKP